MATTGAAETNIDVSECFSGTKDVTSFPVNVLRTYGQAGVPHVSWLVHLAEPGLVNALGYQAE